MIRTDGRYVSFVCWHEMDDERRGRKEDRMSGDSDPGPRDRGVVYDVFLVHTFFCRVVRGAKRFCPGSHGRDHDEEEEDDIWNAGVKRRGGLVGQTHDV